MDNVSYLLYFMIRGRLLDNPKITRPNVQEMMVNYLRNESEDALREIDDMLDLNS